MMRLAAAVIQSAITRVRLAMALNDQDLQAFALALKSQAMESAEGTQPSTIMVDNRPGGPVRLGHPLHSLERQ